MASRREQIIVAVKARLEAAGAPCPVFRCPVDALEFKNDDHPDAPETAISILVPESEQATRVATGTRDGDGDFVERVLALPIACVKKANAAEGEAVDSMVDPLYCWVVSQIMADKTLGGLAQKIDETRTDFIATADIAQDTDAFGEKIVFEITYQTPADDPTAAV